MNALRDMVAPLRDLLDGLSSQGERHLGEVQADLRQTTDLLSAAIEKLGNSFMGIHESMAAQQALLAQQVYAQTNEVLSAAELQERLAQIQERGRVHANAAMTALQFEDMTGQLIGRIVGHVESLQTVLGALGDGAAALPDVTTDGIRGTEENSGAAVTTVLTSLNRVLDGQEAAPSVARKAVAQTHLDSGDIELF